MRGEKLNWFSSCFCIECMVGENNCVQHLWALQHQEEHSGTKVRRQEVAFSC